MLLLLVGLKECGLETQSLGLGWPLSEVETRVGAEDDLFQSSQLNKLGMPSWHIDPEHYTHYILAIYTQPSWVIDIPHH